MDRLIIPPTGDGISCMCNNGPKNQKGQILSHNHGEFRHLLPRFRHNHREPGLVPVGAVNPQYDRLIEEFAA